MTSRRLFLLACVAFVLAPGHPDAFFRGVPLGLWPAAVVALGAFIVCWVDGDSRRWGIGAAMFAGLLVAKVAIGAMAPTAGWLGSYALADDPPRRVRRSTEFLRLD